MIRVICASSSAAGCGGPTACIGHLDRLNHGITAQPASAPAVMAGAGGAWRAIVIIRCCAGADPYAPVEAIAFVALRPSDRDLEIQETLRILPILPKFTPRRTPVEGSRIASAGKRVFGVGLGGCASARGGYGRLRASEDRSVRRSE